MDALCMVLERCSMYGCIMSVIDDRTLVSISILYLINTSVKSRPTKISNGTNLLYLLMKEFLTLEQTWKIPSTFTTNKMV